MKHLVALLTTADLEGLKRLVHIVTEEVERATSLDTEFVIVVNTLDDSYYDKVLSENFPLRVVRTESNGTAAKGKNTCQELMLEEGFDYLTQFDGDDILYPCFLLSLEAHLKRMPGLDVLGIIPIDYCDTYKINAGHEFNPCNGVHASVWGISLTRLDYDIRGVGKHPSLFEAEGSSPSQDFHILLSRKACKIMLDEEMIQAEDHLQSFKYLAEHQKGNLLYVQTMSSDMYFIDKTFEGSVQKTTSDWEYLPKLQEKVLDYVPEWRSSFGELPCLYIDLQMCHIEKEAWIKKIFRYNEEKEQDKTAPMLYLPHYDKIELIGKEMIVTDFMSKDQCDDLIAISDKHGGWAPAPYDVHPAQEIRMKELGQWEALSEHWENYIEPLAEKHWNPLVMYGLRDAFTMRYSLDTQVNLTHHTDHSLVTGSVKLNDDYEGASLIFPRQNVTNDDIPVGKILLFPGQVTHGHYVDDLTSGVKYSLTMWTKRFPQEEI